MLLALSEFRSRNNLCGESLLHRACHIQMNSVDNRPISAKAACLGHDSPCPYDTHQRPTHPPDYCFAPLHRHHLQHHYRSSRFGQPPTGSRCNTTPYQRLQRSHEMPARLWRPKWHHTDDGYPEFLSPTALWSGRWCTLSLNAVRCTVYSTV